MLLPTSMLCRCQLVLALCALLAFGAAPALVAADSAAPDELPPLPSWARGPDYRGRGQWEHYGITQNRWNQETVDAANQEGWRFDFLLYGDSITQLISRDSKAQWAALFPPSQGWLAAPLGVSGNDVEDLTWRIIGGSELPALAPRCIALLIGSNDVNSHTKLEDHISYLDYLVGYLQAAFPDTQLILWKLLPRQGLDMGPANQAYHALAKRRGLTWVACGRQLDADDPSILYDGTHPTPPTQTQLLRCLAPAVYRLVGKSMRRQATPLGTGGSAAPAPAPAAAGGPGGAAP